MRLYPSPRLAILRHDILRVYILHLDSPSFAPISNLQMLEMVQILTNVTNALGTSRLRKLIEAYKNLPRLTETYRDAFLEILRKSDFQIRVCSWHRNRWNCLYGTQKTEFSFSNYDNSIYNSINTLHTAYIRLPLHRVHR